MTHKDVSSDLESVVASALSTSERPLHLDELMAQIEKSANSGAATRQSVRRILQRLYRAVPVADSKYGWLPHLLNGTTYCHPLSGDEVRRGNLLLDELEHAVFFPAFFEDFENNENAIEVSLFGGETLVVDAVLDRKMWSLRLGQTYVDWLSDLGAESRDDLIIRVLDAASAKYEVRVRLREMRDERTIEKRNIKLAVLAEELVIEDSRRRDVLPTWDLVARLIGRRFFHEVPPTDDLHFVLHEYSMLRFVDGMGYQLDTEAAAELLDHMDASAEPSSSDGVAEPGRRYRTYFDVQRSDDESQQDRTWSQDPGDGREYLFGETGEGDGNLDDAICPAYQQYLDSYEQDASAIDVCLEHDEFHMLEAELDMLLQLEAEFGGLLPEQESRKEGLAARLYIDPDTLASMGWDAPDDPSLEDPPFWSN